MTDSDDPPDATPFRVLSLWFALTLSVGALAQLALTPLLGPEQRTVAGSALALVVAVSTLRVRPGVSADPAWRVGGVGIALAMLALATDEILTHLTASGTGLGALGSQFVAVPLGLAAGVAVEWHRRHRER
ncbi:hypothetical protein [Halorubellus sp. PRR65]|uniref:hypothetical protein n=1 Tax=Halorubellus sp. PRR65 TaxID=3098148 RepID=UPI002B262090|nr:hypothetical protein [Halorubellus sp. PRR65]